MFRDHRDYDGLDRALARAPDRESRMPLYLTGFLLAVAVVEQVGVRMLA